MKKMTGAEITERVGKCESGMYLDAINWAQNKLFASGEQFFTANSGGGGLVKIPAVDDIRRIAVNLYTDDKRTLVAKLTSQQPQPVVTPATSSSDDRAIARESEHLIRYTYRVKQLHRELVYTASDALDCGGGWWYVSWDDQAGDEVEVPDPAGVMDLEQGEPPTKKVRTGDIVVRHVPNFEMRVDPAAVRLEDARWVARVYPMSISEVEEKWGFVASPDARATMSFLPNIDFLLNPERDWAEDICRVVEYWERPCKKYPKGFYAVVVNDEIAESEKAIPLGDFPFEYWELDPNPDAFYGKTPMTFARRPQHELSLSVSQIVDGRTRGAFGSWLQQRGANMDVPTGKPHEVLGYNDTANKPDFVEPRPVAPQVFQIAEMFEAFIHKTTGITDTGQATSGKDRLYAAEQDNTKLGPAIGNLHAFLKRTAIKMLNLWREYATFELSYAVGDPNSASDVRTFKAEKIRFRDVDMSIDSALPLNREARREMILNLYQAGLIQQDKALKLMEFGDVDDALGTRNLDRERAREENQLLYLGPVGVEEHEDHQAHLEEHLPEMKQAKWYVADEQAKQQFRDHAALHKQFILAALGAGAPPVSPEEQSALTSGESGNNTGSESATNAIVPVGAPVSARDNAALGVINGREMPG